MKLLLLFILSFQNSYLGTWTTIENKIDTNNSTIIHFHEMYQLPGANDRCGEVVRHDPDTSIGEDFINTRWYILINGIIKSKYYNTQKDAETAVQNTCDTQMP